MARFLGVTTSAVVRAVFSSMSAFAAAVTKLIPFPNSSISLLTSLTVTIPTSLSNGLDNLAFALRFIKGCPAVFLAVKYRADICNGSIRMDNHRQGRLFRFDLQV